MYAIVPLNINYLLIEGSLVDRTDLQALYLSGTYCQKTVTRTPSCAKP